MKQLIEYLKSILPGQITDGSQIETLLTNCWDSFLGIDAEGLEAWKLRGRMEKIFWQPPVLSFLIERHGRTVLGSTRAELQSWQVNIENRSIIHNVEGYRQLTPVAPKIDVKPLAEEIVSCILDKKQDRRLKCNVDGSVGILINEII